MIANLDLSKVELRRTSLADKLPAGDYVARVISAEPTENKAKTGHFLLLTFEVAEGEYSGKRIIERLNIVNPNPDTQMYALRDLKTLMTHGGHKNPNHLGDFSELVGLTLSVILELETSEYEGKEYENNNVKGYAKASNAVSNIGAVQPTVAASPVVAKPAGEYPWGAQQ